MLHRSDLAPKNSGTSATHLNASSDTKKVGHDNDRVHTCDIFDPMVTDEIESSLKVSI